MEAIGQRVDSNACAIGALTQLMSEAREERAELRQATIQLAGTTQGIANLLSSLDIDRPTILRKLSSIENKVDRLLEGSNRLDRGSQLEGDDLPA